MEKPPKLPLSSMNKEQLKKEVQEWRAFNEIFENSKEAMDIAFRELEEEVSGIREEKQVLLKYFLKKWDEQELRNV